MKRILLSLIALFITVTTVNSQSISLIDKSGTNIEDDTITFWEPIDPNASFYPEFSKKGFVDIINNSGRPMTVGLKRIEHKIINGTKDYNCWGETCFGSKDAGAEPTWDVPDETNLADGDTAGTTPGSFSLIIYFVSNGNVGEAIYEYQFYNRENPTVNASIFVKWSISYLTNLEEPKFQESNFNLYPNPANDQFSIGIDKPLNEVGQEVMIRDLSGKTVLRQNVASNAKKVDLNVDQLEGGIYFVSYQVQGNVLLTKKLIVK